MNNHGGKGKIMTVVIHFSYNLHFFELLWHLRIEWGVFVQFN